MLKPFWQKIFSFNWAFGLTLILLAGIPRFIIVLNANITGNYRMIAVIFLSMWLSPFIFLTKKGRSYIGIKKPANYYWVFYSFIAGTVICSIIYITAVLLFKHTVSNWFVYISRSYSASGINLNGSQRFIYFIIYSVTGVTFSPVGEELFYRGLVHGSFAVRFGEQKASVADSAAFAVTHLAHFGIVYFFGSWHFLFIPAILWTFCMFVASRLFFICKQRTDSVIGAIVCHAAFNLAMMYFIFYYIL